MSKHTLKAEKRSALGKRNNALRRQGWLPGNLFGKDVPSQAIQIKATEFDRVYKQVGETGIVYIQVADESKERPTLISGIAADPTTDQKLHVDFHQVNLKEKVTAHIPVELLGESEIVKSGAGVLVQSLHEIEVEALPTDLPEQITFDITSLTEIGDHITVEKAAVAAGVEIKTDLEMIVVSIAEPEKEEEVVAPTEAEAETAEAAAPTEPAQE